MNRTRIEWCDFTLNPVIGCSGSCPYCYARRMATRFHLTADFAVPKWFERNFERTFPRKPSRIFVNSMSDVADWREEWLGKVLWRIHEHPEHRFLFLSKRPWLVPSWIDWPNVMLGYTVTTKDDLARLLDRGMGAVSFLSIEPIHGDVHLDELDYRDAKRIRWVIVGAETGNRRERIVPRLEWLVNIYSPCSADGRPLFFKDSLRPYWPARERFPQEYPV